MIMFIFQAASCGCVNGYCVTGLGGSTHCICHSGYTGDLCDQKEPGIFVFLQNNFKRF